MERNLKSRSKLCNKPSFVTKTVVPHIHKGVPPLSYKGEKINMIMSIGKTESQRVSVFFLPMEYNEVPTQTSATQRMLTKRTGKKT
jgi:hypothetical protein